MGVIRWKSLHLNSTWFPKLFFGFLKPFQLGLQWSFLIFHKKGILEVFRVFFRVFQHSLLLHLTMRAQYFYSWLFGFASFFSILFISRRCQSHSLNLRYHEKFGAFIYKNPNNVITNRITTIGSNMFLRLFFMVYLHKAKNNIPNRAMFQNLKYQVFTKARALLVSEVLARN